MVVAGFAGALKLLLEPGEHRRGVGKVGGDQIGAGGREFGVGGAAGGDGE